MKSKICMNNACRAKNTTEWKEGWKLKSGENATLCYNCGSLYEKSAFCETYHTQETGWRFCICGKHIHCGCIASKYFYECPDFGGVLCITCAKFLESNPARSAVQIPSNEVRKGKEIMPPQGRAAANACHPNFSEQLSEPSKQVDCTSPNEGYKEESNGPVPLRGLDFSLNDDLVNDPTSDIPFPGEIAEGSQQNDAAASSPQGQNPAHVIPICATTPRSGSNSSTSEVNKRRCIVSTPQWNSGGQEVQHIPENSNPTILVPLFEKRLTRTDVSRVGRFIIPKKCAEVHFPKFNQTDRQQILVQDGEGKDWIFQFRFWPNNNSRMYVLEGVIPLIQKMQIQAGDTVTFSRIDPARKLVIDFRKATNNVDPQDQQAAPLPGENSSSGVKRITENGFRTSEHTLPWPSMIPKRKRTRILSDDAMELRVTDAEAQNFMCPSSTSKPTIFTVEQLELEEHNEPPIFGNFPVDISPPRSASLEDTLDLNKPYLSNQESNGEAITDHSRHESGCTCIQHQNEKGKNPCTCQCPSCNHGSNTVMGCIKRKQSEKEVAESSTGLGQQVSMDDSGTEEAAEDTLWQMNSYLCGEATQNGHQMDDIPECSKRQEIDLNLYPSDEK